MIKLVWGVKKMKRKNENKLFIIFIIIKRILLGTIPFIIAGVISILFIYVIFPFMDKHIEIIIIAFLSFGFLCLLYSIGKAIEPKIKKKR